MFQCNCQNFQANILHRRVDSLVFSSSPIYFQMLIRLCPLGYELRQLTIALPGLPQDGPYMELELLVSYNYSYQLFSAAKNPSAKFFAADAIHNSACVLIRTFLKSMFFFRISTAQVLR